MAVPVILDTDIGFDVDDVWALAFLLRCPEVDVKLITTATGDTTYRARIVAKILEALGHDDIPIGVGIPLDELARTHSAWLGDFALEDYDGEVIQDGIGALCATVEASVDPTTVLCIGPLPNIAAALARNPAIADAARFVGMHGSIRQGYLGADKPAREYNVKSYALACQMAFRAHWEKTITPLDTCGDVILGGDAFARLRASNDPAARLVLANHFGWCEAVADWPLLKVIDPEVQSSILFDCVAVYLAFADDFLEMETLPIVVSEDGRTLVDESGASVSCAMAWRDRPAFEKMLVDRLCGGGE